MGIALVGAPKLVASDIGLREADLPQQPGDGLGVVLRIGEHAGMLIGRVAYDQRHSLLGGGGTGTERCNCATNRCEQTNYVPHAPSPGRAEGKAVNAILPDPAPAAKLVPSNGWESLARHQAEQGAFTLW